MRSDRRLLALEVAFLAIALSLGINPRADAGAQGRAQPKSIEFDISYPNDANVAVLRVRDLTFHSGPAAGFSGSYNLSDFPSGQFIPLDSGVRVSLRDLAEATFVNDVAEMPASTSTNGNPIPAYKMPVVRVTIRTKGGKIATDLLVRGGGASYSLIATTDLGQVEVSLSARKSTKVVAID